MIPVFIILLIASIFIAIDFVRGAITGYKVGKKGVERGKKGYKQAKEKSKVTADNLKERWDKWTETKFKEWEDEE